MLHSKMRSSYKGWWLSVCCSLAVAAAAQGQYLGLMSCWLLSFPPLWPWSYQNVFVSHTSTLAHLQAEITLTLASCMKFKHLPSVNLVWHDLKQQHGSSRLNEAVRHPLLKIIYTFLLSTFVPYLVFCVHYFLIHMVCNIYNWGTCTIYTYIYGVYIQPNRWSVWQILIPILIPCSQAFFPPAFVLVSCPDPSSKKQKEGLVFWAPFLVTWGRVEQRKECNYCIPHALHAY